MQGQTFPTDQAPLTQGPVPELGYPRDITARTVIMTEDFLQDVNGMEGIHLERKSCHFSRALGCGNCLSRCSLYSVCLYNKCYIL